jgi:tripartite-type tricarboxylate transporter receptor subunit TctC
MASQAQENRLDPLASPRRRRLVVSLATSAVAALAGARAVAQQGWPGKSVRIVVPFTPGTGMDILARTLGPHFQAAWGQAIVVDNRPGASGNLGAAAVAKSAPDGLTLLMGVNTLIINPALYSNMTYDPLKDLIPIGLCATGSFLLVASAASKLRSVDELVREARARPGKLDYASPGIATPHHMAMELFKQKAGLTITHVPYKGAAPAMTDVMGGQVPVMMLDLASGLPIIRSGKVRVLAIALPQRASALPEVPTFVEAGFSDVNAYAFHGLIGPAGMAPEAVARLNAELQKAMKAPKVVKLFADFGFEALPGTPQDFYKLSRAESDRWGKIIAAAGVKLD